MQPYDHSLYPTPQHEEAALYATDFFSRQEHVDAVLLTCSCARGKAAPGSCVDISVLLRRDPDGTKRDDLEAAWSEHSEGNPVLAALRAHGKYAHLDLDFTDGEFEEGYHGWCSGPDEFELDIGNRLLYSLPLYEIGSRLSELKEMWLPYYSPAIRARRLAMVRRYCLNNIDHIAPYVERELFFQAFRRLYNAAGEFLQALFIANWVYPIAYDKWVKEQLTEILEFPELYPQLVEMVSIGDFESGEIAEKGDVLRKLLDQYCTEDVPPHNNLHAAKRS